MFNLFTECFRQNKSVSKIQTVIENDRNKWSKLNVNFSNADSTFRFQNVWE